MLILDARPAAEARRRRSPNDSSLLPGPARWAARRWRRGRPRRCNLAAVLHFVAGIHKSQGGEYPAVVVALLPGHFMILQRNLLYAAVTRARRLCVFVGSRRAIAIAVKNDKIAARHSTLAKRLRDGA